VRGLPGVRLAGGGARRAVCLRVAADSRPCYGAVVMLLLCGWPVFVKEVSVSLKRHMSGVTEEEEDSA